jgi:hypothetical protein
MSKTLTEIRKELDLSKCTQAYNVCNLFAKIAEAHPEVVYEALGSFLRRRPLEENAHVIALYRDEALQLKELFKI